MFLKELRYYFSTPIAYIVIGLYLLAMSLFLWVIPGEWNILNSGYAEANGLFKLGPWLLMLLCPALTMKLLAEELQTGTWNWLKTQPIAPWRIILGKYFAAWSVVVIAQLPCIFHYVLVYHLAEPVGNVDAGAFFGSFIGLILISAAFTAIGLFASSLTKSQIVAFIVGLLLCFLCHYGFDLVASFFVNGTIVNALRPIGINAHYASISRGVLDLRDLIYFLSVGALFVCSTLLVMRKK